MSDPAPPSPFFARPWLRPALAALPVLLAAGYILVLAWHVSPYASGSDSSGYLNGARLLSQGKLFAPTRTLPGSTATEFGSLTYQPLGFLMQPDGRRMAASYPTGLPLHLLVCARLVGWDQAVRAVSLLSVLASGGLLWLLARLAGLSVTAARIGVAVLWLCPLYLTYSMQPMSDQLALTWSLAALYCALQARQKACWGLLGGAALSVAVLVRPTGALLLVPVLVALGWRWRAWLTTGLGGLPGAAFFLFYNWRVYGSPVRTGYGDIGSLLGPQFLAHNLAHFARWIPGLLSPLVVLAVVAPFGARTRCRVQTVLAVWSATLIGFYVFYFYSGETWWYLRFILPAFPGLIVAALAVLETSLRAAPFRPAWKAALVALLLVFTTGWLTWQYHPLNVWRIERGERHYPGAAHWAQTNLPARSAILCMQVSGAFYYYTDFLLIRWEQVSPDKYAALFAAAAKDERPVYAALFPFETPEALQRAGGNWTKLTTIGQITLWQRQP